MTLSPLKEIPKTKFVTVNGIRHYEREYDFGTVVIPNCYMEIAKYRQELYRQQKKKTPT